jgi:hypothetical protein
MDSRNIRLHQSGLCRYSLVSHLVSCRRNHVVIDHLRNIHFFKLKYICAKLTNVSLHWKPYKVYTSVI